MATVETENGDKIKKPKTRSPNYPSVGLEKAVESAASMYADYKTHPVPVLLLHEKWGYKKGSGIANQVVAALKAYGLVDVTGIADDRKLMISKDGQRIVGNAPDRSALLKKAALAPKIHQEVLGNFGERGLPADDLLRQYLVWERPEGQRFNPETVSEFIERFRSTLTFAGVTSLDTIDGTGGGNEIEDEDDLETANLATGNAPKTKSRLQRNRTMPAGMLEDVFSLNNGQAVIVQWPQQMDSKVAEDMKDWLKIVSRKIQRAFDVDDEPADDGDDS